MEYLFSTGETREPVVGTNIFHNFYSIIWETSFYSKIRTETARLTRISTQGSSNGSGAAVGAYEWLDITIGSDSKTTFETYLHRS